MYVRYASSPRTKKPAQDDEDDGLNPSPRDEELAPLGIFHRSLPGSLTTCRRELARRHATGDPGGVVRGVSSLTRSHLGGLEDLARPVLGDGAECDEHEHAAVVQRADVGLGRRLVEARVDQQLLELAVARDAGLLGPV